jgi:phosphopantothenoylcysteine decarboxylase/phosphopantothenate--cysteine ligase
MLKGKNVLIGVTGSIAAYKMANVARQLIKLGADVQVMMTENACNFIHPLTFESLTKHKCLIDTFDRNFEYSVEHVSSAKNADVVLIAPASANVIGKIANGIADDMLTTTVMAATCKKIISPAMNHNMYHNPIVESNIKELESFGYEIIPAESGMLANGDMGDGRMPDESVLVWHVLKEIAKEKDLADKKILVTAGATKEKIDPVRFITNNSTGKMGCAIAKCAMLRGADVTLVAASISCEIPPFINVIRVESAEDMYNAVMENSGANDIIIKAAAVADFTPETVYTQKVKKLDNTSSTLKLKRTKDILAKLGENKRENQFICGFSMETENMLENSRKKLISKNADMIIANSISKEGSGFGVDTNIITVITQEENKEYPVMSKTDAADVILDEIIKRNERN